MPSPLTTYIDAVVDASVGPASKALAPVVKRGLDAIEQSDGYEAADAALRRLEGKVIADGLEPILVGAMMNGTSGGSVNG